MNEIVATITVNQSSAIVKSQSDVKATTVGIQGPSGPSAEGTRLEQLANVDATNLASGSVLVYKTNTNKWTSTLLLDQQHMEGGEY